MSPEIIATDEFIQSAPEMFYVPVHEAGRALLCFLLGLDFGRTSIVPNRKSAGRVMAHYVSGSGFAEREKNRAAVCFAGEQAVRVIFGEQLELSDNDPSFPDNASAKKHLEFYRKRSGVLVDEPRLKQATYRLLRKHRSVLLELAEQLFFRGFMESRQVRSFLRKRLRTRYRTSSSGER
jgi:hypothetical protein